MLLNSFIELVLSVLPITLLVMFVISMVLSYAIYCVREEIEYKKGIK